MNLRRLRKNREARENLKLRRRKKIKLVTTLSLSDPCPLTFASMVSSARNLYRMVVSIRMEWLQQVNDGAR